MKPTNAMMGGLGMGAYPKDDSKAAMDMYGAQLQKGERPAKHVLLSQAFGVLNDSICVLDRLIADITGVEMEKRGEVRIATPFDSLRDVLDNGAHYITSLSEEIRGREKTLRELLF